MSPGRGRTWDLLAYVYILSLNQRLRSLGYCTPFAAMLSYIVQREPRVFQSWEISDRTNCCRTYLFDLFSGPSKISKIASSSSFYSVSKNKCVCLDLLQIFLLLLFLLLVLLLSSVLPDVVVVGRRCCFWCCWWWWWCCSRCSLLLPFLPDAFVVVVVVWCYSVMLLFSLLRDVVDAAWCCYCRCCLILLLLLLSLQPNIT